MFIHYYLKKKNYYQQNKGTYIKKVVQKPYVGGPTQVSNFQSRSSFYEDITKDRLQMYCINRCKANSYNILILYRKYTNPKGKFQLKC